MPMHRLDLATERSRTTARVLKLAGVWAFGGRAGEAEAGWAHRRPGNMENTQKSGQRESVGFCPTIVDMIAYMYS